MTRTAKARSRKTLRHSVTRDASGWLVADRPADGHTVAEHLASHAGWPGPVKLAMTDDGLVQRLELLADGRCLRRQGATSSLACTDGSAADLLAHACDFFSQDQVGFCGDSHDAATLKGWLAHAGRTAILDEQGSLRLPLTPCSRDGQVRIECGEGRLRFTMPLGQWDDLSPAAESAMLRLAAEANARVRLVRIEWRAAERGGRCQAVADLSGLAAFTAEMSGRPEIGTGSLHLLQSGNQVHNIQEPVPISGQPLGGPLGPAILRGMALAAVDGLEVVLRRLGEELPVLGDPRHHELVALCF